RKVQIALLLGLLGAQRELLAAFVGRGLRFIAIDGLLPGVDLLLHGGLGGRIRDGGELDRLELASGPQHRLADGLGLEEIPQVGGFDVLAQRRRLRALAQRLGKRQEQREYRNHQRDLLVGMPGVLDVLRLLQLLVCVAHAHPLAMMSAAEKWTKGEPQARANSEVANREWRIANGEQGPSLYSLFPIRHSPFANCYSPLAIRL